MDNSADLFSKVQIHYSSENGETEAVGILNPAAEKGFVTIKLPNGYNLSVKEENILKLTVLAPAEKVTVGSTKVEMDDSLPKVTIIHTGGTIASKVDYKTGAVTAKFEPEDLIEANPKISQIANINAVKIGNMFSDDIRPQHWNLMTNAILEAFDGGADGVVVTHGTDTLHITSAALSFAFCGKGKKAPGRIVMTGSQRSSDRGSTDATENLLAAVYWAANGPKPTGNSGDCVTIAMHKSGSDGEVAIIPGCSSRKMHSTKREAFVPINSEYIASVYLNSNETNHEITRFYSERINEDERQIETNPTQYSNHFKIPQLTANAWLTADQIEAMAGIGASAIIIHGTGLGHLPIDNPQKDAPENDELWRALYRCVNREIPVIITNQCINGPVDMNVYAKGRKQQTMGILGHGVTTSPDTVAVKVHWALCEGKDISKVLTQDLCGENNSKLYI